MKRDAIGILIVGGVFLGAAMGMAFWTPAALICGIALALLILFGAFGVSGREARAEERREHE